MKTILKFKVDNQIYALIQIKNNIIPCKSIMGKISFNLSIKEISLINQVCKKIIPAKIFPIRKFNYNNKKFVQMIDQNNFFYVFYEIKNGKISKPSKESLKKLNNTFNNQTIFSHINQVKKNLNQDFFQRVIQIGKKTIIVLVSATYLFIYPTVVQSDTKETNLNIENITSKNQIELKLEYNTINNNDSHVTVEEILYAIQNNTYLSTDEKKLFLSNQNYFKDNIDYFDKDLILETLNHLKVQYHNDTKKIDNKSIAGTFHRTFDSNGHVNEAVINIYNNPSFNQTNPSVLTHEFCHAFGKQSNFGSAFKEFLNTVFNNEYFGQNSNTIYDNGYYFLNDYGYALCEIIDDERILRRFHADHNPEYITNELKKIIPNEKEAIKLLTLFDTLNTIQNYKELQNEYYKIESELKNLLIKYYETKTNESIHDNPIMEFYLNKDIFYKNSFPNYDKNIFKKYGVYVEQYKRYLSYTDSDETYFIKLNVPIDYKITYKYVSVDQIMKGIYGYKVENIEDITLKKMPNGLYEIPVRELVREVYFIENKQDKVLKKIN